MGGGKAVTPATTFYQYYQICKFFFVTGPQSLKERFHKTACRLVCNYDHYYKYNKWLIELQFIVLVKSEYEVAIKWKPDIFVR